MATTSLLKANPSIWKSNFSFPSPSSRLLPSNNLSFFKPTKFSKTLKSNGFTKFTIECFSTKHSNCEDISSNPFEVHSTSFRSKNDDTSKNPFEVVANTIMKNLEALKKPAVTAILMGFLLVYGPHLALAASGGRMGGRAFSSQSSSSKSYSSSSSSSSSSSRSVGSSSSPSYSSSSSSSPSYSSSSSSSSRSVDSSSSPSYSSSRSKSNHSPTYSSDSSSKSSDEKLGEGHRIVIGLLVLGLFIAIVTIGIMATYSDQSYSSISVLSVLKVQVGLSGAARSLQKDLNQIAETADTSTTEGLSYILTETTVSLLRHPNHWISGYSSVAVKGSTESAEELFNRLSISERGKLDEETLVNVNNNKKKSKRCEKFDVFNNEYIVVTILVAADRRRELPTVNGNGDLKEALKRLGSIPKSEIKAVEVLWTPQNENDTLSEQELHEDYPSLRLL